MMTALTIRPFIAIILAASGFAAQDSPPVLSNDGNGALRKDGKPFRAIGVNYFSCFYRTLLDGADTSYEQGFEVLAREGIPFVRFAATGKPSYNEEWLRGRDLNPRPSGYEPVMHQATMRVGGSPCTAPCHCLGWGQHENT
jgi:hypothetical protein